VLKDWVRKASEEIQQEYCELIVMLIPARTDTKYFHEYIYKKDNVEIEFIK
jgi:site-specific DNA-methyltransferase (adenine-specific)